MPAKLRSLHPFPNSLRAHESVTQGVVIWCALGLIGSPYQPIVSGRDACSHFDPAGSRLGADPGPPCVGIGNAQEGAACTQQFVVVRASLNELRELGLVLYD
jgi:hypothetical protein